MIKKIIKLIISVIFIVIILEFINLISLEYFDKSIDVQLASITGSAIAGYFILSPKQKT